MRCGHCKTVFDGVAKQISLAPQPQPAERDDAYDEAALGPPTVTLRSAQALHPAVAEPPPAEHRNAPPRRTRRRSTEIAYEERFAWAKPRKSKRANAFYAAAIPVLIVGAHRSAALPLSRRNRRALARGEAGPRAGVRSRGLFDPSAARSGDAVSVDRRLRSAGRSSAQGSSDPASRPSQSRGVAARISAPRVHADRRGQLDSRASRADAGRLRGWHGGPRERHPAGR